MSPHERRKFRKSYLGDLTDVESFDQIFLLITSGIVDINTQETLEHMLPKFEIELPLTRSSDEARSVMGLLISDVMIHQQADIKLVEKIKKTPTRNYDDIGGIPYVATQSTHLVEESVFRT
jgi:hypothetical protein